MPANMYLLVLVLIYSYTPGKEAHSRNFVTVGSVFAIWRHKSKSWLEKIYFLVTLKR